MKFVSKKKSTEDNKDDIFNGDDDFRNLNEIMVKKPGKLVRKKITRRKPGTKPSANYFNDKTQKSIVDYQNAVEPEMKKKIFVQGILPAFESLVENLINVYGFTVMYESKQDLKNECVEFLYGAVGKFNPEKGSKAFSYFNVVAKNWLTIKSKQNSRKVQTFISLDNKDDISMADLEIIENFQVIPSLEDIETHQEARAQLVRLVEAIKGRTRTDNEALVVKAIQTLIENLDDVDLLEKRALLVYIREIAGLSSKQLSIVLSSLKKHYRELRKTEEFEY